MAGAQADKFQGFSLSSVCWGYRDIFAKTLQELFERGMLGAQRPEITASFFALMRCSEQRAFDHVLKEFLLALNPHTAWILELPGIFAEVTEMGRLLAESKLYYGVTYFRILGEGGFGRTPRHVRTLMTCLGRLRVIDDELAFAFLKGYRRLVDRLTPSEINLYVQEGLRVYQRNHKTGLRFMEGTLKTSEAVLRSLTNECRLGDVGPTLERLLRALAGYEVEVGDLGSLDSDSLIERNTRMVCMYRWLYLPVRVRYFENERQNHNWYLLAGVVAAGMLCMDSFSRIHGHPAYPTCAALIGDGMLQGNLYQLVEYARVLRGVRAMWPGARRLIDFGLDAERNAFPPKNPADRLFFDLVGENAPDDPAVRSLLDVAEISINAFDTASLLTPELASTALETRPGLDRYALRTVSFMPDFFYPATVSQPPRDSLVADLKDAADRQRQRRRDQRASSSHERSAPKDDDPENEQEQARAGIEACYLYDEWSQEEGDYYQDYCHVHERHLSPINPSSVPGDVAELAARTRRVFEMLRPEITKQKFLPDGDEINVDLLTNYMVERRIVPSPRINFYEKPFRNRRDLAVLVLLDVSGSTGADVDHQKTIEIEKHAALILGHGLATLDDRFAVCGFSGNGREMCEFFTFKGFDESWTSESIATVLSAYPRSSTRIGAALRHAGYRLAQVAAKQRLIILLTDGKPMDTGYDPNTRYAQYDVRMACEENKRKFIHTFCVSTEENSRADMEIMFPERRFVILDDIRRLPAILPQLYIKMTI
jgi:nitric oxide reductase activation protein